MQRDARVYLEDMLVAAEKVAEYTKGLSFQQFCADSKTFDAVLRNLEVIGEAAKNITDDMRSRYPAIEWRKITGLRDILIHEYFGIDEDIIWDVVQNKVPELAAHLRAILR